MKAFAFQRLNLRLYFNIKAYFVQECRKGIANFIVLGECIHLWDSVESGSVRTVVHMGMYVGCLVVLFHISDVISLKSDLLREKLYLFKGSTLSQFDAPFCDARLFSIILAFFDSVMFCLSVLMFLFIRVCSVSAISGSLFFNGTQWACDHS